MFLFTESTDSLKLKALRITTVKKQGCDLYW